jgi:hypothetical protein
VVWAGTVELHAVRQVGRIMSQLPTAQVNTTSIPLTQNSRKERSDVPTLQRARLPPRKRRTHEL